MLTCWLICREGLVFVLSLICLSHVQKDALEFVRLASYSSLCQHSSIVSATAVLFDFRFISRVQLWIAAYSTTDDSPIFHYSFWQMLKLVLLSDTNSCHNVFIFFLKQCKAVITFKVTAISHCIGGIWQGFLFYLLSSNTIYLIQSSPLTDQIMLYTYFSQIYALLLLFIQDFLLLYPTFTVSIFTKLELSLGL